MSKTDTTSLSELFDDFRYWLGSRIREFGMWIAGIE